MEDISKAIKKRRVEIGLTQEELAKKLGYKSRATIAKIESGENSINQLKIKAFAEALETTPEYLLSINKPSFKKITNIKADENLDEIADNINKTIIKKMDNSNLSEFKNTKEFNEFVNSISEMITTTFLSFNHESFNAFTNFIDKSFNNNITVNLTDIISLYKKVLDFTEYNLKKIIDKEGN